LAAAAFGAKRPLRCLKLDQVSFRWLDLVDQI
jgi:hypothetical protein